MAFGTRAFRNLVLASVLEAERIDAQTDPSFLRMTLHINDSDIRFAYPAVLPTAISRAAKSPPIMSSRPQTADSTRPHTTAFVSTFRPHTADSARPNTADTTRPQTATSNGRPHTADSARPHIADSSRSPRRPNTAGSIRVNTADSYTPGSADGSTTHLNPYNTFPSPPNSYSNHSLLSSLSTSPPRRGLMTRQIPNAEPEPESPKSAWSDS
ncbi:hypothetical protein C8R47DRAFT_1225601 [Mycena vitilis]|nr:hypothetical protein C8R47DRAFT_1225601 [Mycena vitilis]